MFLPRVKVGRLVRGAVGTAAKLLYQGYFFARFCPQNYLASVKCSRGVLRVLSSGRIPIPVNEVVIREMRNRIGESLKPGTGVPILTGPIRSSKGGNAISNVAEVIESLPEGESRSNERKSASFRIGICLSIQQLVQIFHRASLRRAIPSFRLARPELN